MFDRYDADCWHLMKMATDPMKVLLAIKYASVRRRIILSTTFVFAEFAHGCGMWYYIH